MARVSNSAVPVRRSVEPEENRLVLSLNLQASAAVEFIVKRSVLAVVAGVLFVIVVTTLVDIALHLTGVYPPTDQPMSDPLAVLATSYRIIIGIAGAWVTARLAPHKPMKHALILGSVGTVLALVGVAASWGKGLGPDWYPIALAVLAIPQSWLGGRLFEMQLNGKSKQAAAGV